MIRFLELDRQLCLRCALVTMMARRVSEILFRPGDSSRRAKLTARMKKTISVLALTALTILSASAQNYTGQRIGQFYYYHGSDGSSWTQQNIGNFQYQHGTDAQGRQFNGTGQTIGQSQYWHVNH
jgi:hypothetical protein